MRLVCRVRCRCACAGGGRQGGVEEETTLSDKHWQFYTAATSVFAVLVSVYCLSEDITGIFVHLYYIPILICLLYTSDAADDLLCVDLGGRRIIKKKKKLNNICIQLIN